MGWGWGGEGRWGRRVGRGESLVGGAEWACGLWVGQVGFGGMRGLGMCGMGMCEMGVGWGFQWARYV